MPASLMGKRPRASGKPKNRFLLPKKDDPENSKRHRGSGAMAHVSVTVPPADIGQVLVPEL